MFRYVVHNAKAPDYFLVLISDGIAAHCGRYNPVVAGTQVQFIVPGLPSHDALMKFTARGGVHKNYGQAACGVDLFPAVPEHFCKRLVLGEDLNAFLVGNNNGGAGTLYRTLDQQKVLFPLLVFSRDVNQCIQVVFDLVEVAAVALGDFRRDIALGNPVDVLRR